MKKRYIISSVVPGAKPNVDFLEAIDNYCKYKKAELILIPTAPLYKDDEISQPLLRKVIIKDRKLNDNLYISLMPINPETVDPISGLDRQTQLTSGIIFASPKQRLKSIASPKNDLPRMVMTPGACTKKYYRDTKRGIVAARDHIDGAIIVEIENSDIYHFRQVQASKNGSFIDLGVRYNPNGKPTKERAEAIIPGDWHCGFTDPVVVSSVFDLIGKLKPKYTILHDFADCISINHHIEHKWLQRAKLDNLQSLENELALIARELKTFENVGNKVVIVKSNHDQFLDRWLEEGNYVRDPQNHIIGLELALAKSKGFDPLLAGISKYFKPKRTTFLRDGDSFTLTKKKIECGVHGHRGPNGARGSASALSKAYGTAVTGHQHSPEIQNSLFVVGTSTYLQLSYNGGPSSWCQTLCIVYKDGSRQLINIINKKYSIDS